MATVRILYKSGQTVDFKVKDFTFERDRSGTYTWELLEGTKMKPLQFGADDVAAVWEVL